ncbi:unnamed protein product, partial [Linum tenue]
VCFSSSHLITLRLFLGKVEQYLDCHKQCISVCWSAGVPDKSNKVKQLEVSEWMGTALGPLK